MIYAIGIYVIGVVVVLKVFYGVVDEEDKQRIINYSMTWPISVPYSLYIVAPIIIKDLKKKWSK
jgi:hypothetical protein